MLEGPEIFILPMLIGFGKARAEKHRIAAGTLHLAGTTPIPQPHLLIAGSLLPSFCLFLTNESDRMPLSR